MKLSKDIVENLKSMLAASVKNDLDKWTKEQRRFVSPEYDYQLIIDSWSSTFELSKQEDTGINYSRYHKVDRKVIKYWRFWVLDKEVNECAKILIDHFTNKENSYDNNFFRGGVEQFQKSFLKDVRKEKIKKLKK